MRNQALSKQEQAYKSIKADIIKGAITHQTMLTESFLCAKYNISRTPIREALRRLTSEGFIVYVKDKGAFVADINLDDWLQYYEMREALEGMAARLCCMRITPAYKDRLEQLIVSEAEQTDKGNYVAAMAADMEFHRCILDACRNTRLAGVMNTILDLISCIATNCDKAVAELSIEDHKQILEALNNGDGDLCASRMKQHIIRSKNYHLEHYFCIG